MFTLSTWRRVQTGLLSDPAYIGMKPGAKTRSVALFWAEDGPRTPEARRAIDWLLKAGIGIQQVIGDATQVQVTREADRLIAVNHRGLAVYVAGPDAHASRVDVRVAIGSFADATREGTDVVVELSPRVPVVITEGARPKAASHRA